MQPPPSPIDRPKLASWLFERSLGTAAAAEALGCSEQTVLNMCKPFGEPGRTVPREALLEKVVAWTEGAVTAVDFYPAHLRGPQRYEPVRAREDVQ
jgi:hypothetical protein